MAARPAAGATRSKAFLGYLCVILASERNDFCCVSSDGESGKGRATYVVEESEDEAGRFVHCLRLRQEYQRSSGDDKALLMHEICSYCSHFAPKVRTTSAANQ